MHRHKWLSNQPGTDKVLWKGAFKLFWKWPLVRNTIYIMTQQNTSHLPVEIKCVIHPSIFCFILFHLQNMLVETFQMDFYDHSCVWIHSLKNIAKDTSDREPILFKFILVSRSVIWDPISKYPIPRVLLPEFPSSSVSSSSFLPVKDIDDWGEGRRDGYFCPLHPGQHWIHLVPLGHQAEQSELVLGGSF